MNIYTGFSFSVYFKKYLDSKGIKSSKVAEILNIPYQTFRSKLNRDKFSYTEVLFLDIYYIDLGYIDNFKKYIALKNHVNN